MNILSRHIRIGSDSSGHRISAATAWVVGAGIVAAALLGALVPSYVSWVGGSTAKLAALPAVALLFGMLALSRIHLFLVIVLIRAGTETLFETTRMSIGGSEIGIGGLLNIFAILIAAMLIFEKPREFPSSLGNAWLPFLAVVTFGLVLAPDHSTASRMFLQVLSAAAVAFCVSYYVRSPETLRRALKLVVWSSAIPVAYGLFVIATGRIDDYPEEGLRLRSTFSHPNPFAFYLTLVISIVFAMLKSRLFQLTSGKKLLLVLYLLVLLACLLLSKTRSAWAACAVMFIAYAIFFERRYFVYLAVAGVAALFVPGVGDRLVDLMQGNGNSLSSYNRLNSFAWRQNLWGEAIGWMSPARYLTGYGLQGFPFHAPSFALEGSKVNLGAHNVYVQLFFDLGLVGIGAFAWLYGRVLYGLRGLSRVDPMIAVGITFVILEFIVVCASDNMLDYLSYNWYLWFVIGVGVAAVRLRSDDTPAASALGGTSAEGRTS